MKKNNILLLGFTVPEDIAKDLFLRDLLPAVQTHKFGWSLTRSLKSSLGGVVLASSCPIQNYPLGKKLLFRGKNFNSNDTDGVLLGFINLLLLKQLTRFLSCVWRIPRLIRSYKIKWIFLHGLHSPYLVYAFMAKIFGMRIGVVLTDPPGVVLPTDDRVTRCLKQIDILLIGAVVPHMDAVIALAPQLASRYATKKRTLVLPGILNSEFARKVELTVGRASVSDAPFYILYAGGLSQAYGVDRLVDAVVGMETENVRLKLYGRGDQVGRIEELASHDPRIEYGGFVDDEILVPELLSAELLVNPRPTDKEFATMSFPSKLIEYLATGRPVLTTKISSIPDSYKRHFYFISDESVEGIREAILKVMSVDKSVRLQQGAAARTFINSEASECATGRKIAEFLDF